jgi:2-iminobutanoate/2-iminopropanoate deaminase
VVSVGAPPAGPYSPAVVAGGFVYTAGVLGIGDNGALVGPDAASQSRRVLDQLRRTLEAAGSSLAQVVSTSVYVKRAEDLGAVDEVYRAAFATAPPARTMVVTNLPNEALVEISAIAVPVGAVRQVLRPVAWPVNASFSYAVRAGDLVFLSGITARRSGKLAASGPDMAVEVPAVLEDARVILSTAGLDLSSVVASRVYIAQLPAFGAMNTAYGPFFPANPPVRATAVAGSSDAGAGVTISLVATAGTREVIGGPVPAGRVLSPAIRAGRHVFVSGMLGNTADNATDIAAQTRETLAKIAKTLAGAEVTFADVADSTVFLPDLSQFAAMNAVYREFFPSAPPARATIGTPLVVNTGLVEIMVTAIK